MNNEEQRTHKKALQRLTEDMVHDFVIVEARMKEETRLRTEALEHVQTQIKINRELVNSISSEMHYRKQLHRKFLGRLRWLVMGR